MDERLKVFFEEVSADIKRDVEAESWSLIVETSKNVVFFCSGNGVMQIKKSSKISDDLINESYHSVNVRFKDESNIKMSISGIEEASQRLIILMEVLRRYTNTFDLPIKKEDFSELHKNFTVGAIIESLGTGWNAEK